MVPVESLPPESIKPGRKTPVWAPGIVWIFLMTVVAICFLVTPGIAAIAIGVEVEATTAMRAGAIAVGVLLLLGSVLFVRSRIISRRVYKFGGLVSGTITQVTQVVKNGNPIAWRYKYEHRSPNLSLKGKSAIDVVGQHQLGWTPASGDTVFVAYDVAKPKRNHAWWYARDGQPINPPGSR